MTASSPNATTNVVDVASFSGTNVKREWWVELRGRKSLFDVTMAGIIVLNWGGGLRYLKLVLE